MFTDSPITCICGEKGGKETQIRRPSGAKSLHPCYFIGILAISAKDPVWHNRVNTWGCEGAVHMANFSTLSIKTEDFLKQAGPPGRKKI